MAHEVPVKIECRRCYGDGFWTHGFSKPVKTTCTMCEGRKHLWVSRFEVLPTDVVIRR